MNLSDIQNCKSRMDYFEFLTTERQRVMACAFIERFNRSLRSAWNQGLYLYVLFCLIPNITDEGEVTEEMLLNGANDWKQFSEGGCALVADSDIAWLMCSPSERKRLRNGARSPGKHWGSWIDVQTAALKQAADLFFETLDF